MHPGPVARRSLRAVLTAVLAVWVAAVAGVGAVGASTKPAVIEHGKTDRRVIALTIDDCWSPETIAAMMAILQRERVNVTWFPVGRAVAAYPDVWKAIASAGFPIANHTYSHAYLTRHTADWIVADIRKDAALIERVTGTAVLPLLRPPMGDWDSDTYRAAAIADQAALVLWDVSFNDTGRGTAVQYARAGSKGNPGSIVLLHANRMKSAEALEIAIRYYRAHGYGFVTLTDLLGMEGPSPYPAFTSPELPPSPLASRPRVWSLRVAV